MLKQLSTCILTIALSGHSFAVEPMTEDALSDFSLDSGDALSVLQLYGPTSAGLSIDGTGSNGELTPKPLTASSSKSPDKATTDSAPKQSSNAVDETSVKTAAITLQNIEEKLIQEFKEEARSGPLDPNLQAIVKIEERVVGQAAAFDTTSEIRYNKSQFKHDAKFNADGSVQHDRNLKIDLLKFENVGGDDLDDTSTIGSIYISDWRSEGSTTTTVR